jgi:hypothetical protein
MFAMFMVSLSAIVLLNACFSSLSLRPPRGRRGTSHRDEEAVQAFRPQGLRSWDGCSPDNLLKDLPTLQSLYANLSSQKVKTVPKLAVILRGQAFRARRGIHTASDKQDLHCEGDPNSQFNAVSRHINHLNKLSTIGYQVDVFMSTVPCRNQSKTFVQDIAAMYGYYLKKLDLHHAPLANQSASYQSAIDLVSQYMTSSQVAYDYFLVQRLDWSLKGEEIPRCLFDQTAALELAGEDFVQFIPAKSIPCFIKTVQAGLWEFEASPLSVSSLNYFSLKYDPARQNNDKVNSNIQGYEAYLTDWPKGPEPPGQRQAADCVNQFSWWSIKS